MIQLTLTLKMTTAQVVERSVTVNNNSAIVCIVRFVGKNGVAVYTFESNYVALTNVTN